MDEEYDNLNPRKTIAFLILILIICAILTTVFTRCFALDEFIDDYNNENYVSGKHNIVRNAGLNAMELDNYNMTVKDYQDFTTYSEVNDGGNELSHTATRSTWASLERTDSAILRKDFGADYFGSNHFGEFDFRITNYNTITKNWYANMITFSDDGTAWSGGHDQWCVRWTHFNTTHYRVSLVWDNGAGGLTGSNYTSLLNVGTTYYLSFEKTGAFVETRVFSDSDRTIQIGKKVAFTMGTDKKTRYLMCPQALDFAQNDNSWGYVEYLWIGGYTGGTPQEGTYYTTDLLLNVNGSTEVLLYNCTEDGGSSIKFEFSPDNATWEDHNGVNGNSDNAESGFGAIDMRDLAYSTNCYIRVNFTEANQQTPRMYQIRLVTDASVSGVSNISGFLMLMLLLISGISIYLVSRRR